MMTCMLRGPDKPLTLIDFAQKGVVNRRTGQMATIKLFCPPTGGKTYFCITPDGQFFKALSRRSLTTRLARAGWRLQREIQFVAVAEEAHVRSLVAATPTTA